MSDYNSWRDFIISVPRPIPPGMMVKMRGEDRDGKRYVIEFLEPVPEYQPNPYTRRARVQQTTQAGSDKELRENKTWRKKQ